MSKQVSELAGPALTSLATLRIILEQSLEWRSPVYINFIDFKKAFDISTVWRIMRHYGTPLKIVPYVVCMMV